MCRQWARNQSCSYGRKCQFAHGAHELVSKALHNPNYKSKKCTNFHTKGYCPYGARCKYIHDEEPTHRASYGSCYFQKLLAFHVTFPDQRSMWSPRKRLPVFEEISSAHGSEGNEVRDEQVLSIFDNEDEESDGIPIDEKLLDYSYQLVFA